MENTVFTHKSAKRTANHISAYICSRDGLYSNRVQWTLQWMEEIQPTAVVIYSGSYSGS